MYAENGLLVDVDEVEKVVTHCDVFSIGFRLFPDRLLVDTRWDGPEGPLVKVVPPVSSVQERFFELGRLRPRFPAPQRFMFFFWPHSLRFLQESGLMERIRQRCAESGFDGVDRMCQEAFQELQAKELLANLAAIRGQNCHTLWDRAQASA